MQLNFQINYIKFIYLYQEYSTKTIKMLKLLNYFPLSNARVPVRATEGSVGYDVFAYNEKVIPKHLFVEYVLV